MSQREEKNSEATKDTGHKSLLLSLWKKVSSGGKGGKKRQVPKKEEETAAPAPEGSEEETAQVEELPFEKFPAPEELMEYYLHYCQGQGREGTRSVIEDFCGEEPPEATFLKQVFSQLETKVGAVMKAHRKQIRLAVMKAEKQLQKKEGTEEPPEVPEEDVPIPPVDGQVLVFCTPNWSAAWGIALPALGEGAPVTWETTLSALDNKKVTFGIDQEAVNRLSAPENILTLQKLASCVPPVPGEDGRTEEHFPRTVGTPQLVENDQGIVDFDNLNWLTHIDAGTVICDIVQPTQGKPGTNIQGNPIRPYNGKRAALPKGDNVILNEEGTSLVAKVDGQISFRDGKFHVNNVIVIKGDVDLSTGSIDVQGDVVIHGTVRAGFTVNASGNVTIGGLVEGSQITAGGSVMVGRGMNGNVTGSITAGQDVVCKYMENATVHVWGDVRMDSIVNCDISARGKVVVKSGRGIIVGGTVRAMGGIEAKVIGNRAGRLTILSIGPTPWFLREKAKIEEELEKIQQEIYLNQGTNAAALYQMKEKPLKKTMEEMELRVAVAAQKQIVAEKLYPMAQVSIGGVQRNITDYYAPCRVYLDAKEGAVKIIGV
ncbi:MAG: DUF342 domain-containing protein [Angelakisella sp.]|nr:DUF342 domain-containing protein [Angelakisella sp.]